MNHQAVLHTTELRCAPWCTRGTCVPEKFCTDVHFGGAEFSFVLTRWCIRQFCMFAISSDRDGAQYDVISLAVSVCNLALSALNRK